MRNTHEPKAALKALLAAVGVSAMVMASAPAHAGPFDALKKMVKKEAAKEFDKATPKLLEAAVGAAANAAGVGGSGHDDELVYDGGSATEGPGDAKGNVEYSWKVEEGESYHAEPKMSQNGTTVPTASQVGQDPAATAADAEPQDAFMYFQTGSGTGDTRPMAWDNVRQKGLRGEATDKDHKDWIIIQSLSQAEYRGGVFVASGDVNDDGRADIIVGPGLCKLVQNGTTVATAEDILMSLSPEEQAMWSRVRNDFSIPATCAKGKLVQNGTTVATASEVQAPTNGEPVALLLPAVQAAREAARGSKPARAGMSQNGHTTVETADEVQAQQRPQRMSVKAENSTNIGSSTGGAGGAGKVKFDRLSIKKRTDTARAGMSQNGTTVATASEVQAPQEEDR